MAHDDKGQWASGGGGVALAIASTAAVAAPAVGGATLVSTSQGTATTVQIEVPAAAPGSLVTVFAPDGRTMQVVVYTVARRRAHSRGGLGGGGIRSPRKGIGGTRRLGVDARRSPRARKPPRSQSRYLSSRRVGRGEGGDR